MTRVILFHDNERPNTLRIVETDGGEVFVEVVARHNGAEVASIVRVSRERFRRELLGWLL